MELTQQEKLVIPKLIDNWVENNDYDSLIKLSNLLLNFEKGGEGLAKKFESGNIIEILHKMIENVEILKNNYELYSKSQSEDLINKTENIGIDLVRCKHKLSRIALKVFNRCNDILKELKFGGELEIDYP